MTFYAEPRGGTPELMAVMVEVDNGGQNKELDQMDALLQQVKQSDNPQKKMLELQQAMRSKFLEQASTHTIPDYTSGNLGSPDFDKAEWVPFKTNLTVDFGPGDGARWLWVSFKSGNNQPKWDSHHIIVQTSRPVIQFTNPKESVISQPMIHLKGYCSDDLGSPLYYQVFDQNGVVTASGEGLVNDKYYDTSLAAFTTNYFTCYDIQLSPGTNTIVLQGTDSAGFSFTTNFVCVFTTAGDTNPPVISIDWPHSGMEIGGDSFTLRGQSDDPTAKMVGQIVANGLTNKISALVERDGYFWFEEVPLASGINEIMFTATDAAGNSSSTNLIVIGTKEVLTMNPVIPDAQLWQTTIRVVTGKVHPVGQGVWINGVQATVKPDGTWLATNVPVVSSPGGGTALFDMTSLPPDEMTNGTAKLNEIVSAQASLGTNAMVLNASSPACGVFNLHLAETDGRSFILETSTNLVEWLPLLTNSTPDATFDYLDTNADNFHCRFFRVVPLQ